MLKKSSISAIILTLNEEKNIKACLESIKWADEIVIVDSYSTDQTIEIAKKYTDKIYFHKFEGDFSKQRNFAITKAKGEWILFLDADETLPAGAEKTIRQLIENTTSDGFWFPRRNYINDKTYLKHGLFYPDWQLRLIRNKNGLQFKGKVHEQPDIPEEKTQKTKKLEIHHNSSRTKYDSFFSFHRLFPFIKKDGHQLASLSTSTTRIFLSTFSIFFLELGWNLIRRDGYKDGWNGIRATLIYAFYKEVVVTTALLYRLRGKK